MGKYHLVLTIDEFTNIYIRLKNGAINDDFLNMWRSIVHHVGFVNIVIGQDFLPKFWTDDDITNLNAGSSVNGLGTASFKKLSYLSRESAEEMIQKPILLPNGES